MALLVSVETGDIPTAWQGKYCGVAIIQTIAHVLGPFTDMDYLIPAWISNYTRRKVRDEMI